MSVEFSPKMSHKVMPVEFSPKMSHREINAFEIPPKMNHRVIFEHLNKELPKK